MEPHTAAAKVPAKVAADAAAAGHEPLVELHTAAAAAAAEFPPFPENIQWTAPPPGIAFPPPGDDHVPLGVPPTETPPAALHVPPKKPPPPTPPPP